MEKIIARIKEFEGFSLKPYKCSAGKWTIGYGFNYQDRGFKTEDITEILENGFTKVLAEKLVKRDAERCLKEAEANFWFFNILNEPRQAVMIDMLYQLGLKGLQQFKKFLEKLGKGDFEGASAEMVHSKWFTQSGRRSRINTAQMKTGIWQEVK